MFSEGGKKCSRLHETNPQDDHNKEKGLVLLTLFWGNKYISTEGKALCHSLFVLTGLLSSEVFSKSNPNHGL